MTRRDHSVEWLMFAAAMLGVILGAALVLIGCIAWSVWAGK